VSRGLFYADRAQGRRVPQVGLGIAVDDSSSSYRLPPPRLGEHTDQVLREWLGYDEATVARLRSDKII
jgi:crotonobetainyl-CoA:carnitine CoA-transferase CaiB-like acyl-CoA transferase